MRHYDLVFDGPPGPEGGRFVEAERDDGTSFRLGQWLLREDNMWVLRVPCLVDFEELLLTQARLQAQMGHPTGHGEAGFKENMLHAIVEVTEALGETNFKPWKAAKKEVDLRKLATEMTDVLQFWANAALAMGLTPELLTEALRTKWGVNLQRMYDGEVKSVHAE